MGFKKKSLDEDECLRLDNQICFPLYAVSKEVVRKYKPFLDEIGLTYTQYIVMMVIWEGKKLSVQELGERLYLDSGTLTPLLVKLEKKGLVERSRSHKDERVVEIAATEKGTGLKVQAREIPKKISGCLGISVKDVITLKKILDKSLKNITES
ncbi:MarR family transcriptional regulator [Candidatus Saccharibacteria bacterium]|nr:MarR family transcriptional regulator [Candidatus Saccharibacteria bacterium]